MVLLGFLIWKYEVRTQEQNERMQAALLMNEQQTQSINALQNELKISKQNAELLAMAIRQAQAGNTQPNLSFTVQAPTVASAAENVAGRIGEKDSSLPPQALEKTDETIVAPQEVKKEDGSSEFQVGIYKVNNYRNWDAGVGVGVNDGKAYFPISLQRNFAKDKAVAVQVNLSDDLRRVDGGQVIYIRKMDKLFLGLF